MGGGGRGLPGLPSPMGLPPPQQDQQLQDPGPQGSGHQAFPAVLRLPLRDGLAGPDEEGAVLLATFGFHFMVREAGAHGAQVQPSEPPFLTKAGRSPGLPSLRRE